MTPTENSNLDYGDFDYDSIINGTKNVSEENVLNVLQVSEYRMEPPKNLSNKANSTETNICVNFTDFEHSFLILGLIILSVSNILTLFFNFVAFVLLIKQKVANDSE